MEKISETYENGAEAALDASRVAQSVAHQLRRTHGQLVGRFLLYFSKVNLRPIEFGALALIAEIRGGSNPRLRLRSAFSAPTSWR